MVDNNITSTSGGNEKNDTWQNRLMPYMVGLVLTLTFFFFAATLFQLYELNSKIETAPELQYSELLKDFTDASALMEKQWKSLVVLESHVLQQRYHQANILLMARVWVRYLGFVTGMILSLIGAVFILGKLREPSTELTLGGDDVEKKLPGILKIQLVTQSPGIVLVTLGTALMLITILVHHPIEVNDRPVYTSVNVGLALSGKQSKPAELISDSALKKSQSTYDDSTSILNQARSRHKVNDEE